MSTPSEWAEVGNQNVAPYFAEISNGDYGVVLEPDSTLFLPAGADKYACHEAAYDPENGPAFAIDEGFGGGEYRWGTMARHDAPTNGHVGRSTRWRRRSAHGRSGLRLLPHPTP